MRETFFYLFKFSLILVPIFFSTPSFAKYKYILDFDSTLIDDSRLDSSWKTPWVLKRITKLGSSTQINSAISSMPETIEVSFAELISILNQGKWANGNGVLGSFDEVSLTPDPYLIRPKKIIPGYYFVNDDTYKFYRTPPNGQDYALQHYTEAKARIRRQKLNPMDFAGPAFSLFQEAMSQPETVGDVHIFTARDQDLQPLFDALLADGHIQHSTGVNKRGLLVQPTVHKLQGIESILYDRTLVANKKEVVRRLATNWALKSSEKTLDYSAHNPLEIVETHTVIVAEDDPSNVLAVGRLLSELSHEHTLRKIKFVLMYSAPTSVIVNSIPPYNKPWMVFDQGLVRSATDAEIKNYTGEQRLVGNLRSTGASSCNLLLK